MLDVQSDLFASCRFSLLPIEKAAVIVRNYTAQAEEKSAPKTKNEATLPLLLEDEEECLRSPAERLCRGAGRIKMTSRGRSFCREHPAWRAVAARHARIHRHRVRDVFRRAAAGSAPEQKLRRRSGVSGVCEERPVLLPFVLLYSVAKCGFLAA